MPGPCNPKKRKIKRTKAQKPKAQQIPEVISTTSEPTPIPIEHVEPFEPFEFDILPREPPIYDPGNGPRVKDLHAFLASSFCSPPSLDDELCAEFAQEELLDMLYTVLPHELALVLWHNKSRKFSRICPACRRLYRLGEVLSNPLEGIEQIQEHPLLLVEQDISGLCSPVCFILASINYPEAIRLIYGRMADEMEDVTWEYLNSKGYGRDDAGLSMVLRMTRLHDLGLAQLCLPDVEFDDSD